MRVGLIIYGDLATVSGGYLYDRKLVDRLRAEGDAVEIISLPWRDYGRHLADNLSAGLIRRLRDGRFDVLLQDELNHPSLVVPNRLARRVATYPIVCIVHHLRCREARPAWRNALYRAVERRYLASVDGFVCNSRTTRREVERLVGGGRPTLVAEPAGDRLRPTIAPEQIAARAHSPGPLEFVFVGNIIPRKGLHILLAALAALGRDDWRLSVVGSLRVDRRYAAAIGNQIARAGLSAQVRLLGALDDRALASTLERSHVLAVPSLYEGFGIVYLEGMGFGLPAIATTAGGAPEIVTDGETGWLVAPDDPAALAAALRAALDDRARLAAMGQAARRRYEAHPAWSDTTGAIRSFLREMIAAWPPHGELD